MSIETCIILLFSIGKKREKKNKTINKNHAIQQTKNKYVLLLLYDISSPVSIADDFFYLL